MRMPSGNSSTSTPRARRFVTTALIRSLSLTRNSVASAIRVSPSAHAARHASNGSSSMHRGISSPPIRVPCRRPGRTTTVPTVSPPTTRSSSRRSTTPMRPITSKAPMRVGLRHTSVSRNSPSSASAASAAKKAADDGSAGTSMLSGCTCCAAASRTPFASTSSETPRAANMRSVWSRERTGSRTDTDTPDASPASSSAPFTCALACAFSHTMGCKAAPCTRMGSPSCPSPPSNSIRAPMARNGTATRRMGRALKLASPSNRALRPRSPATRPVSSRVVVPLLPQSNGTSGEQSPSTPTPCTVISAPSGGIATPIARRAAAVA